MNASTHHRGKLTILAVFIYLNDTSIAATHRFFYHPSWYRAIVLLLQCISEHDQSTEAIYVFQCTFQHTHSAHNTISISYPYGAPCKSHTQTIHLWTKNIVYLCMQRHDFAIAVKGTTSERGWVCISDIPCSKSRRSCFAAGSPNLCRNMKLRVYQQDNICSSHSFVFSYVELATPRVVHWWKSTRQWPVSGPVLDGHGAYCPAQGQITHTNHTSMN